MPSTRPLEFDFSEAGLQKIPFTLLLELLNRVATLEGASSGSIIPTVTAAAQVGSNIDVTIQLNVARQVLVEVWASTSSLGTGDIAPSGYFSAVTTGVRVTDDAFSNSGSVLQVLTDSTGKAVVRCTNAGALSRFVNVGTATHTSSVAVNHV